MKLLEHKMEFIVFWDGRKYKLIYHNDRLQSVEYGRGYQMDYEKNEELRIMEKLHHFLKEKLENIPLRF